MPKIPSTFRCQNHTKKFSGFCDANSARAGPIIIIIGNPTCKCMWFFLNHWIQQFGRCVYSGISFEYKDLECNIPPTAEWYHRRENSYPTGGWYHKRENWYPTGGWYHRRENWYTTVPTAVYPTEINWNQLISHRFSLFSLYPDLDLSLTKRNFHLHIFN